MHSRPKTTTALVPYFAPKLKFSAFPPWPWSWLCVGLCAVKAHKTRHTRARVQSCHPTSLAWPRWLGCSIVWQVGPKGGCRWRCGDFPWPWPSWSTFGCYIRPLRHLHPLLGPTCHTILQLQPSHLGHARPASSFVLVWAVHGAFYVP